MDFRELDICTILYEASGYVSQDDLCSRLNIRPRTLRECLKNIRDVLLPMHGDVIHRANRGYCLKLEDKDQFRDYLQKERIIQSEREYSMPVTQEGRVAYLIRSYLSSRNYMRYEDLADQIYTSRTTVYADMKIVRERLAEYGLSLESRSGLGFRIAGDEKKIRSCISDYFFHDHFAASDVFINQPLGRFDSRYAAEIDRIVTQVLERNHYSLTDTGKENLNIHILIALFRIQSKAAMEGAVLAAEERKRNIHVYRIACELKDAVCKHFNVEMPESETDYIMIHLLGRRVFDEKNDVPLIRSETMNTVREILTDVLNRYGIDFFGDIDLFTMLCMHLQPMIDRLRNGIRLKNPVLEDIKESSPIGYEIAASACSLLEKKYHAWPDVEEIGYLALHFQLALERKKQNTQKKKILTVCASGAGTSRLLMYRIRTRFGNMAEEIRAAGLQDLKNINPDDYDLIVSTVPLQIKTSVPVVQVKYSLNDDDVSRVEQALSGLATDAEFVRNVFRKELFFSAQEFRTPKETICFLCDKMIEYIGLPAEFKASVLEREKLCPTDLGLGIAMPHPMTLMAEESLAAVCHLKQPVRWGSQNVTYVFLIASRKEGEESYALFSHVLYALVNDREAVSHMNAVPEFDTLQEEINRLCIVQKERKPESIFQ